MRQSKKEQQAGRVTLPRIKNNKKQLTDIKVRTWRLNVYVMEIAVLKIEKMEKQQQNNNLLVEDLPGVKKTSYPIKIA